MKFTDRFITVPIKVYNIAEKELTGKENSEDSYEKIDPFEIASYRPTWDSEFPEQKCCGVTYKSGSTLVVFLSIEYFEEILNNFKSETIYQKQ